MKELYVLIFLSVAFYVDAQNTESTSETCSAPTNLTLSNLTPNSADLSWAAGSNETDGYDYILITDGSTPDSNTNPTGNVSAGTSTLSLTDLTASTIHKFYVRSICGGGNVSNWSEALSFTTNSLVTFQEVIGTPFDGVRSGSIAFSDVDGNGTQDVLITGYNYILNQLLSKLYTNDGNGNFTEDTETSFDAVYESSIAFSDVDGNGTQDVLITGENSSGTRISKLYTNDGDGNFTEETGTPFEGVYRSSIAFADVDSNGTQDVLITGWDSAFQEISKLYTNDGDGNFTVETGTPFEGVKASSIAFADVDGDSDQDVLITGSNSSNDRISKLYTNDGDGNFTVETGTPFDGVEGGSIAFADVDGNGTQDVLITGLGLDSAGLYLERISKLYTNNGSGDFTEMTGTPFDGLDESSIAFADVDNDGDQDVLITGGISSNLRSSKIYINDGSGNFTEDTETSFEAVVLSSIAFSDVDDNGTQDILITGRNSSNQPISKLYVNNTTPLPCSTPTNLSTANITANSAVLSWDAPTSVTGVSDGYDYVLITDGSTPDTSTTPTGNVSTGSTILSLSGLTQVTTYDFYVRYNCVGVSLWSSGISFTTLITCPAPTNLTTANITTSSVDLSWDASSNETDGYDYVLITDGTTPDGNTTPTGNVSTGTTSLSLSGLTQTTTYDFYVRTNCDDVNFWSSVISFTTETCSAPTNLTLANITLNSADLSWDASSNETDGYDYVLITDGSTPDSSTIPTGNVSTGTTSIILSGLTVSTGYDVYVRSNCGNGDISDWSSSLNFSTTVDFSNLFEEVTGTPFDQIGSSSIAFSDVDGNGTQDVLITGASSSGIISKLYTNDGSGNFTEETGTPFEGVYTSSIAFADVDSNGTKDVLITGRNSAFQPISKLYTNDGSGNFTEETGTPFEGVSTSSIAFADVDGDSDQDVLITGSNSSNDRISKLYTNDGDGNFTEVTGTPFDQVGSSSIAFADVDGNGTQDVLITGRNSFNLKISKLYTNNGSGNFTEVIGTPFHGVEGGSIAFADVDGNGTQDVLITGFGFGPTGIAVRISKLYTNNGSGNFTEVSTPFVGVYDSSIAFADVENDGDQDVLITGLNSSGQRIAKLYSNDGSGSYTEETGTPFDGVFYSSIAFSDIDGDGDQDVLITGQNSSQQPAKLYRNTSFEPSWTGYVNSLWSESGNWSNNAVPTAIDVINIPNVINHPVIAATDNIEIDQLTLIANAKLDVSGVLKVNRNIINNGEITFKSNAAKTGQLDEFTGSISGSGNITVERYIPAGKRAFRLISPSVTTTSSIYDNWQEGGASPTGFGTHITGVGGSINGFDVTATNNPSLFTFDNSVVDQSGGASWTAVANTNVNTLPVGTPYRLLVRGDRNVDLFSNTSIVTATVLRAKGDLHIGDFSPTLSSSNGNFSFVGNPYQAAVDFNTLTLSDDVNANYIYVWDAQQGSLGSFVTIDMLDGSNTVSSNANEIIQPGQAFFIRNNSTITSAPSLTFKEASKDVAEEQLSTFSTPNYTKLNLQLFSATDNGEEIVDAIGLRFSENFQNEINDADAGKMGNTGENLALVNSNQLLSIEQRAKPIEGEEIQLFANSFQSENYSFKIQLENASEDFEVYIKDNYLDTQTLIDAENDYSFSVDQSITQSTSILRFSLVFENVTLSNTDFDQKMYSVYPNPTKGQLSISGIEGEASIKIFDVLGRTVLNQTAVKANQAMNVEALPNGVYILQVNDGENSFSKKFIKQ